MADLELITKFKNFHSQTPYGEFNFRDQKIIVLPTVFPPIYNTTLLSEIVEELAIKFIEKKNSCQVFEMGLGSGAAILTVAKMDGAVASASDIAPMATLNTKVNALWWGVKCDVYGGNLFENVPQGKFDIIFWSIPVSKENPEGTEDIRFRSIFDPDYKHLTQFLDDVNNRLLENGQILLALDYDFCDLNQVYILIDKADFKAEVYRESKMAIEEEIASFAYLLLTRK